MHAIFPAAIAASVLFLPATAHAGEAMQPAMEKKTTHLSASAVLPFSAEVVWSAVAEDYGRIAQSHPLIVKSEYINGSLKGELGAERDCWFDEKGKRKLHEQVVAWDPENMQMQNRILQAWKFPIDPDNTLATYTVEDLGDGTSRFLIDMDFRTKPAFMSGMMKSSFEGLLANYFIALEHHLATGETVTVDNFKAIARDRAASTPRG
jgi:hypothetical protein